MTRLALVLIALLLTGPTQAQDTSLPFERGSMRSIVSAHAGQPFVLAVWSLDCVYCRHDLAMFGRMKAEYPDLTMVLVATDAPARRGEIPAVLENLGLESEQSWIFADSFIERLAYEIDPEWFGELPRTYFYEPDGSRTGVSGKLDESVVELWIQQVTAAKH